MFLLCPLAEKQSISIQDALRFEKQLYKSVHCEQNYYILRIISHFQKHVSYGWFKR